MNRVLPKTVRQFLHCGSRSASHAHDKKKGDARRENVYIAVEAESRPSPHREFRKLTGFEAIRNPDGSWRLCKAVDEFGEYLLRESAARAPFREWATRRGRREMMSRIDRHPLSIHTASFHPAVSSLIANRIARGEDGQEMVKAIAARFAVKATSVFAGKRYLLGLATHTDSDDLHIDTVVARNGQQGRHGGGLGLVGPWTCGVHRQLKAGAKINPSKRAMFEENLRKFRSRQGATAVPLDIMLADAIDQVSAKVLGPELQQYMKEWAEKVPGDEKIHVIAALTELDRAREKLLCQLEPSEREKYLRRKSVQAGLSPQSPIPATRRPRKEGPKAAPDLVVPYQPVIPGPEDLPQFPRVSPRLPPMEEAAVAPAAPGASAPQEGPAISSRNFPGPSIP